MGLRSFKYIHLTTVLVSVVFFFAWLIINYTPLGMDEHIRNLFTDSYWVIAFLGGIVGLLASKQWGWRSSSVGNLLLFLSLGLLLQAVGQIVYAIYYLFLHIEVPYPSLGDIAYFSSTFAYIASAWHLMKVVGVIKIVRKNPTKLFLIVIPILILVISYRIFIWDYDWTDWSIFKLVMDFGQPLAQVVYISMAFVSLVLSWGRIGGVMRGAIVFVIMAFFLQYSSDFYYAYRATYGGWRPAYLSDLLYVFTYLITSQAIYLFFEGYRNLIKKT